MRLILAALVRIALFILILFMWSWVLQQRLSNSMDISIIVGGDLLIIPIAWLGRKILDKKPTASRAAQPLAQAEPAGSRSFWAMPEFVMLKNR